MKKIKKIKKIKKVKKLGGTRISKPIFPSFKTKYSISKKATKTYFSYLKAKKQFLRYSKKHPYSKVNKAKLLKQTRALKAKYKRIKNVNLLNFLKKDKAINILRKQINKLVKIKSKRFEKWKQKQYQQLKQLYLISNKLQAKNYQQKLEWKERIERLKETIHIYKKAKIPLKLKFSKAGNTWDDYLWNYHREELKSLLEEIKDEQAASDQLKIQLINEGVVKPLKQGEKYGYIDESNDYIISPP